MGTESKNVCNGETGYTETLPEGKTETGTYVISGEPTVFEEYAAGAISFPIPLEAGLNESHVIFVVRRG